MLEAERSDLIKSFIIVGIPDDLLGHVLAKFMFDSGEFVQPLLVILDGLQVAGGLDAFCVGGLLHLEHFVAKAVSESGEKKLVFDKQEGVRDSFSFYFGLGGSGGDVNTYGSHGGRLFVRQAFVGLL
ncbi:MAG: hypothetical protein ACK56I_35780, partial [bacterium]